MSILNYLCMFSAGGFIGVLDVAVVLVVVVVCCVCWCCGVHSVDCGRLLHC